MAEPRRLVTRIRVVRDLRSRGLLSEWNVDVGLTHDSVLSFGSGCAIAGGALLAVEQGELALGDDVVIGNYSNIRAVDSFVRIGSRVQLAQFVSLIAANHLVEADGVPQRVAHDLTPGAHGIVIGDDCWLGVGCTILPGVTLGERCIIGAGAVVTHSFAAGSRVYGVPGRAC
jgi:acetyltransferase-like isoleucine patch superfamily enzyme